MRICNLSLAASQDRACVELRRRQEDLERTLRAERTRAAAEIEARPNPHLKGLYEICSTYKHHNYCYFYTLPCKAAPLTCRWEMPMGVRVAGGACGGSRPAGANRTADGGGQRRRGRPRPHGECGDAGAGRHGLGRGRYHARHSRPAFASLRRGRPSCGQRPLPPPPCVMQTASSMRVCGADKRLARELL
jgi:hypothetical protein